MIYLLLIIAIVLILAIIIISSTMRKRAISKNTQLFANVLENAEPLDKSVSLQFVAQFNRCDYNGTALNNDHISTDREGRIRTLVPEQFKLLINFTAIYYSGGSADYSHNIYFDNSFGTATYDTISFCDVEVNSNLVKLYLKNAKKKLRFVISISINNALLAAQLYKYIQQQLPQAIAA